MRAVRGVRGLAAVPAVRRAGPLAALQPATTRESGTGAAARCPIALQSYTRTIVFGTLALYSEVMTDGLRVYSIYMGGATLSPARPGPHQILNKISND